MQRGTKCHIKQVALTMSWQLMRTVDHKTTSLSDAGTK